MKDVLVYYALEDMGVDKDEFDGAYEHVAAIYNQGFEDAWADHGRVFTDPSPALTEQLRTGLSPWATPGAEQPVTLWPLNGRVS